MARPRKPVLTLVSPQKCRIDARLNELALPAGPMGEAPDWFGPTAYEEWIRLTTELAAVLNPAHRSGLIALCALTQRETDDFMQLPAAAGSVFAPGFSASERNNLHSLRMQFAVTPASQSKVKMPEKKAAESKWADTKPIPISKPA